MIASLFESIRSWWEDWGPRVLVLLILTLCLCGGIWSVCNMDKDENHVAAYNAWCKLNGQTNLTLHEWNVLRIEKMLPGQRPE